MRLVSAVLTVTLVSFSVPAIAEESADGDKVVDRSSPDYVRCKRLHVTGSIASRPRVCKTNAEWANLATRGQAEAAKLIEDNTGRPPGGP